MNAVMFATWMAVGLLTGGLAGIVIKDESHGVVRDLALGVIGSSAATAALTVLDGASDVGLFATAFVAFAGAALVIIAQRKFWHARG
jgi:uncharacterized membrane protein YeaQ/YmgE (transglycosylase-associated protein family)